MKTYSAKDVVVKFNGVEIVGWCDNMVITTGSNQDIIIRGYAVIAVPPIGCSAVVPAEYYPGGELKIIDSDGNWFYNGPGEIFIPSPMNQPNDLGAMQVAGGIRDRLNRSLSI